ncbi:hypothetical protein Golax_026020 [Gossypium laxum]|uniref:Putative plant transposon protein domain-containing protein n=1 Tax=Gossypium laxum TaxID=34288 RepID=A0A7J9B2T7_9ROSI|nr:hypothetical protein [Gossypium laxum]
MTFSQISWWEHFWTIHKDITRVLVVQEFYASLQDHETRNTEGHLWESILVRGKEVRVTPRIICDFYNIPYYENDFIDETDLEYFRDIVMDNIIIVLTEGRGEWKYCSGTNIPISFHKPFMFPEAKMWIQFVCTRIFHALNDSNVNTLRQYYFILFYRKSRNVPVNGSTITPQNRA